MGSDEERQKSVGSLLQAILDLTRKIKESTIAEQLDRAQELLQSRHSLVAQAAALHIGGLSGPHGALLRQIQNEDSRLLAALRQRETEIARQLGEIQKEKALLKYQR